MEAGFAWKYDGVWPAAGADLQLELLAQAFGKGFARVSGLEELKVQLGVMMEPETALKVLEVDTTASENSRIFTSFFEKIK